MNIVIKLFFFFPWLFQPPKPDDHFLPPLDGWCAGGALVEVNCA